MKTWKDDGQERFARLYQWSAIFGGLDFSRSLFLVYFLSLGFSGAETGILQAALFWSSFALEVPSGVFADRFGRKRSVVLGLCTLMITFIVLANVNSIFGALLGFALWGASFAFISGAGPALLYDGLKESGRLSTHLHWMSRTRSLSTAGIALSIFIGGYLYGYSPTLIFWASAASAAVALILLWPVPEPTVCEGGPRQGVMRSLTGFLRTPSGRRLMVFMAGMGAIEMAHTPFFVFSQILFKEAGLPSAQISWILGSGFLLSAVAQRLAPRFASLTLHRLVIGVVALVVLAFAGLGLNPSLPFLILIFLAVNAIPQILLVHTDQYIQDHCDSQIRASLLSVQSFTSSLMIGVSYLTMGFAIDHLGAVRALALLSIPVILGGAIVSVHLLRAQRTL